MDPSKNSIVCRKCGAVGDHYTLKCPYVDLDGVAGSAPSHGAPGEEAGNLTGKYVPPRMRSGAGGEAPALPSEEELTSLRLSNLDDSYEEDDIRELIRGMGKILRVSVAKDQNGVSRGFAFIQFEDHATAERARVALNGLPLMHRILKAEFPKPSSSRRDDGGSGGMKFTGYGKALPQGLAPKS
jgi:translation initiation factor 3 subunit G